MKDESINTEIKLSIIIPCKNEEKYIGKLLNSLVNQNLSHTTEVIIADANSTDETLNIITGYSNLLPNLKVIKGGLPSFGRNAGASEAKGNVLLFLDSDCYFKNNTLVNQSLKRFKESDADILGCLLNIDNNLSVRFIYSLCNLIFYLSKLDKPFVVGTFMMIKKDVFLNIGGFDESLMHCEDYFLSREVSSRKYAILNEFVYTDDRRFKKMGVVNVVKYFLKNTLMKEKKEFFKNDIGYWL
jgi:glycosyltransferase involved in cell wall biosynthesis